MTNLKDRVLDYSKKIQTALRLI